MKYCPLCQSEYRDEVAACSDCTLQLVASLDEKSVRDNPPRLLWAGRSAAEFDRVATALREAGIPARAVDGGNLGRLFKSDSTIRVLSSDFVRAVELAGKALEVWEKSPTGTQTCHACSALCSAALAACPQCHAILRVQAETESALRSHGGNTGSGSSGGPLRYCPMCDSEYSTSHARCSVCGVELVSEEHRGQPLGDKEKRDSLEVVWRGGDPVALSRVVVALQESAIRHHVQSSSDHLVFELAMPRPKYIVRVLRSDLGTAGELLASIQDGPFFGTDASLESQSSESGNHRKALAAAWNPAAATTEVWSSDDSALTRLVQDCLSENRIGFRTQGIEPGTQRLLVPPQSEVRAREIIRQIVEGTPQE